VTVEFLLERFAENEGAPAVVWHDDTFSYGWLAQRVEHWRTRLDDQVPRSSVLAIESDFTPESVAALVAAIDTEQIVVPLTESVSAKRDDFLQIAEVEWSIFPSDPDAPIVRHPRHVTKPLLLGLRDRGHPGLVLFSSGSTGESKAALHDFEPLLEKFHARRDPWCTIPLLLFDHIGGINTLLYSLSNCGCLVALEARTPEAVCAAIERHGVEMLPTSPTFLNLLIASRAFERYDLGSLRLVTYGTEPMPETTLKRLRAILPDVALKQTYGLSEVGILRSRSESSDSLWLKIGGEGYETRVVDGLLEIKADAAMLGYLNAPSPFTPDGWFKTGDAVEVNGEYLRILGRESEIINVGGEKVYPAEIEDVLQQMDGVVDTAVVGEEHGLVGQIVVARVELDTSESRAEFRSRMRRFCADRLEAFKIPQKVELVENGLHGERFKKQRRPQRGGC
jgi:long-chain acyl-CoA synthetase